MNDGFIIIRMKILILRKHVVNAGKHHPRDGNNGFLIALLPGEPLVFDGKVSEQVERSRQERKHASQLMCYAEQMELTEEIKEKLIDKVKVYSNNRIEIYWKFESGFSDTETT